VGTREQEMLITADLDFGAKRTGPLAGDRTRSLSSTGPTGVETTVVGYPKHYHEYASCTEINKTLNIIRLTVGCREATDWGVTARCKSGLTTA
jgi:hypothetical protein